VADRHGFIPKLILYIGATVLFSIILLAVYNPIIEKDLFYYEDRNQLGPAGDIALITDVAIKEGRYGYAYLLTHLMGHTRSSGSTRVMRYFGIIGTALFATVILAILKRCGVRTDHAILTGALLCTLPSIQIYILWIVVTSYIVSAFLSSVSALIMINIMYSETAKGGIHEAIKILTSIILFVISLTIHQTVAMIYWTAGIIAFLGWDNYDFLKKYRRPLVKYFSVGFVSIAVYYVVFIKIVPSVMDFSVNRSAFITFYGLPLKVIKFIIIPFNNAVNLWNVYPSVIFAVFIIFIIISGIRLNSLQEIKELKRRPQGGCLPKYYLILCLLILSYFPNLIVAENAFTYRTLIPLSAAMSILFFFGFINIIRYFRHLPLGSAESRKTAITVLLAALFIVTSVLARYNAVHWDSPAQLDVQLWEKWGIP
jgi:hypothetical protein